MGGNITTDVRASYTQPALIGGLVLGVLSALPLINIVNVCCCLWVITGGAVAAYLLQQNQAAPISAGDGAVVGFLAGLAGSCVMFAVSIPIELLMAPLQQQMLERMLNMSDNMPPELRRILENYAQPRSEIGIVAQAIGRIVGFFFVLVVCSIFSTIGGLLGAAVFRKPQPQVETLAS